MSRPTRIAGSFAIVMIAYWAYALLAVPWIEPSTAPLAGPRTTGPAGDLYDEQKMVLRKIFPAGSWQITDSTILESDKAKLVFQKYHNFADGRVEIKPCTIVVLSDGPGDEDQRIRQSIILDAPGGAVLQFDPPLDLTHAKLGRLVAGRLNGEVVIRSDMKNPGPEDDLKIVTRDVELTPQAITTPYRVEFSWGPNRGCGRDMVVRLLTDPAPVATGINILGMESIELRHVEYLHFELEQAMATSRTDANSSATDATDKSGGPPGSAEGSGKRETTPIGVCCQGPFRFDAVKRVATFRDDVQVTRLNSGGTPDQISCQLLSLFFTERKAAAPAPEALQPGVAGSGPGGTRRRWGSPQPAPPSAPSLDLLAERLEAQGNPVVLIAPSQAVTARGQRMEYNLLTKSIAVDGDQPVFMQQGPNEIHAAGLRYEAAEQGRMGRVAAQGPGWLRGQLAQQPGAPVVAAWKGQLQVSPDGRNQVVALTGGAELNFPGMGQLQAPEIFLWLAELPPAAPGASSRLRPDRMLARNAVHLASPQLSGNVEQMEVWFAEGRNQASGVGDKGSGGAGDERSGTAVAGGSGHGDPSPAATPATQFFPAQSTSPQRFEIVGRVLRARVLLDGPNSGVSHLVVEDGVRFLETQTARPGERPLLVRGDRLEIADANGPGAKITVLGQFARFEARGLGLTGSNIHFDRGENSVRIDGPGQMDLPFSGGLTGPAGGLTGPAGGLTGPAGGLTGPAGGLTGPAGGLTGPAGGLTGPAEPSGGPATVDWQRGMTFDGQTAKFAGGVVASSPGQKLWTESMEVQLQQPVHFSQPAMAGTPQVEEVRCYRGVRLEHQTRDTQGQLAALDRMHATDLAVNLLDGALTGGPGEFSSVRRGSDNPLGGGLLNRPAAAAPPPAAAGPLKCLHVVWEHKVTGNLLRRQLTFGDQVRTGYASVDDWDKTIPVDNPDKLGPDGVAVNCDQLSVAEVSAPMGGRKSSIELTALGSARVDATTFTARANRISYSEAKDLMILEGDGRSDAELFRQENPGTEWERLPAQQIWFWPSTKRWKIVSPKSLQIIQVEPGKR